MNDAALLDSLHAALRNPDLAWYTEFHAGESIVAGYLDSLTDPYDDDIIVCGKKLERLNMVVIIVPPSDRKSTRLNSSHKTESRMPSSA